MSKPYSASVQRIYLVFCFSGRRCPEGDEIFFSGRGQVRELGKLTRPDLITLFRIELGTRLSCFSLLLRGYKMRSVSPFAAKKDYLRPVRLRDIISRARHALNTRVTDLSTRTTGEGKYINGGGRICESSRRGRIALKLCTKSPAIYEQKGERGSYPAVADENG